MEFSCFECGQSIAASGLSRLGDVFVDHARSEHEWPYPDQAIRNYAEATQRLTGGAERLPAISTPSIHPVTCDRTGDWLDFFDHDAFVGRPEWAGCYCLEPHVRAAAGEPDQMEVKPWQASREAMESRICGGETFGYLAYVDQRPAGWVNASKRSDYSDYYRPADEDTSADANVIGISCFAIAPPYRRHGVAGLLLDRVIRDAPDRDATCVDAYPFNDSGESDNHNFRGPRSMYEERGFEPIEVRERDTIMRLEVPPRGT